MPRPIDYIPGVYESQGRLSDLIRNQGAVEARRIQNAGLYSGQMWNSVGHTIGNALSQIAEYKADEPRRKHQETLHAEEKRKLSEATKFRGLEQMAGAGNMNDADRAALYKQEGFYKEGQQVLDADRIRKAQEADQAAKELERQQKRLSGVGNTLRQIKDPEAYAANLPQLLKDAPELQSMFPQAYDQKAIEAILARTTTAEDQARYSQIAAAEASRLHSVNQESRAAFGHAQKLATSALMAADDPQEWQRAWALIDSNITDEKLRSQVTAQFSREFSPQSMQQVRDYASALNPDKTKTELEMKVEAFQRANGRMPGPGELDSIADSTVRFNPNTYGANNPNRPLTRAQKNVVEKWKEGELLKAEKAFREQEIDIDQLNNLKEQIQASYLVQLGVDSNGGVGSSLADMARGGPAAPPPPAPQGSGVMMQSPDGKSQRMVPADQVEYFKSQGATVVGESAPAPAPAPPPPSAPQASGPPVVRDESVNTPAPAPSLAIAASASPQQRHPERVLMVKQGHRSEWVPGTQVDARMAQGWSILNSRNHLADAAGDVARRIYRDLKK